MRRRPPFSSATPWRKDFFWGFQPWGWILGAARPQTCGSFLLVQKGTKNTPRGFPLGTSLYREAMKSKSCACFPTTDSFGFPISRTISKNFGYRPFKERPAPVFRANRWLCPFNRPTGEVGIDGCIDQKPEGICCSGALQTLHLHCSSTKAGDRPEGGRRRFGYFAAEGKVTRAGARNSPKQTER